MSALDLAKKLLAKGANPNVRIEWKEPRFGKEGGTARNPPNIQLGRHFLSYRGATPFYIAAKNGDYQYMRVLLDASRQSICRIRRRACANWRVTFRS
jgi:ankyrin repeat protein